MISVFSSNNYFEAQLVSGLLREHGIDVFLQGALLQGGIGELPASGYLSIMVEEADRVAAERIVATYDRGDFAIDDDIEDDSSAPT